MKPTLRFLAILLLTAAIAPAQAKVLKDIAYDDEHASQILDFYPAKTDQPAPLMVFIHGGGWRGGSKNGIPGFLAKANAEGWLAVVSVEYRFTDVATHPAQVDDCARAIQFIRQNAKKWNVDPTRMGVTGGSAGGHLSAYLALQDDEAKPDSKDPVERQSSRVSFAIPFAGPTDWGLLSKIKHEHPAYRQLLGYEPGTAAEKMSADKKKDVSPLTFVSEDDPPFLIVHGDADVIVPVEHAKVLQAALQTAEVPTELHLVKGGNHGVAGAGEAGSVKRADAFMRQHLLAEKPTGAPASKLAPEVLARMREVHAGFKGQEGYVAQFGDSITYSRAFWSPMSWDDPSQYLSTDDGLPKAPGKAAWKNTIKGARDKGPKFANYSGWKVGDLLKSVDAVLARDKPETAIIMVGTNDINGGKVPANYRAGLELVIAKCLAAHCVPILNTIPPRRDHESAVDATNAIIREIATAQKIPLADFHAECLRLRPGTTWDGTIISKDGVHPSGGKTNVYDEANLKASGYALRNWVNFQAFRQLYFGVYETP